MNLPGSDDYIDIHTHDSIPAKGIFSIEALMAHEKRVPENIPGILYTCGIHPWYLDESNQNDLTEAVKKLSSDPLVIAIGEAGFDKMRGPVTQLQQKVFE